MKFNKKAVQDQLDLAASELEKSGFADLAEKVDYYNDRLVKETASELPLIRRALQRILHVAKQRLNEAHKAHPLKSNKARSAVLKSRRSAALRKETSKRRLKTIVAKRKKAAEKLELLRAGRQQRRSTKDVRRSSRKKRIAQRS